MAAATVDRIKNVLPWQITLGVAGGLAIIAGVILELVIAQYHSTTAVVKAGNITTTTTGPPAPASGLVTGCLGAGVLLLLAAAFFSRISKVVVTGIGEIDIDTGAELAAKAAAKAGGDPDKTKAIYKRAASKITAQAVMERAPAARSMNIAPVTAAIQLNDADLQRIVDEAASEEG
jgi:hypothetical protein